MGERHFSLHLPIYYYWLRIQAERRRGNLWQLPKTQQAESQDLVIEGEIKAQRGVGTWSGYHRPEPSGWVLWPLDHPGSPPLLSITFLWPLSQALWKDSPASLQSWDRKVLSLLVDGHPFRQEDGAVGQLGVRTH